MWSKQRWKATLYQHTHLTSLSSYINFCDDFGEDQNDVDVDFDDVVDGDDNLESDGDDGHLYKHIWSTIYPITQESVDDDEPHQMTNLTMMMMMIPRRRVEGVNKPTWPICPLT